MDIKYGTRIQIKAEWENAGNKGKALGVPVFADQYWLSVKMDNEEDPTFMKYESIEAERRLVTKRVAQIVYDVDKWYIYIGTSDDVTSLGQSFESEYKDLDHLRWLERALGIKFEVQVKK